MRKEGTLINIEAMVKVYSDNTLQKISMANIYLVCSRGSYYADSIGRA